MGTIVPRSALEILERQCRQAFVFVIGDPIFPAMEWDANPFESPTLVPQRGVRCPESLLLVVGASPRRLRNRVTRPASMLCS